MARKVKVALFNKDLRAELKNFPLSADGTKIEIAQGGKAHFKPKINNESFIEFPYRHPLSFWKVSYQRIYFAMKWSKKCVNFHTGEVFGPDPDAVMEAASAQILKNKAEEEKSVHWTTYATLGMVLLILLKVLGVIA